jgi:hypothetical protein
MPDWRNEEFLTVVEVAGMRKLTQQTRRAHSNGNDVFRADQLWLYAAVVTVGHMLSRGLAKSGSRDRYPEKR